MWRSRESIPTIWLHNYAEWQGKQVRKHEAFKEYAKQIGRELSKIVSRIMKMEAS